MQASILSNCFLVIHLYCRCSCKIISGVPANISLLFTPPYLDNEAKLKPLQRMLPPEPPELSIIIPFRDEAEVLPALFPRLTTCLQALSSSWEVIAVDDGSTDSTMELLTEFHRTDPRIKVVSLSRNFGQQTALQAGLHFASANIVAMMDADLQDPPELLQDCIAKLRNGYDIVYAIRRTRKEPLLKRWAYAVFYRLLHTLAEPDIPLDSGDFCVMRRTVADVLKAMPERNVFVRGLRAWAGFRQVGIEYDRGPRAAGKSKYSVRKLLALAADGLFSFSTVPLRLATCLGILVLVFSVAMGIFTLLWRLVGFQFMGHTARELPGWTTLVGGMFIFGGMQLLILGCIGEYIARIYIEVKQRPRWIIRQTIGLP